MCLNELKKFKAPVFGYKVFLSDKNVENTWQMYRLYGEYKTPRKYQNTGYPLKEWITAQKSMPRWLNGRIKTLYTNSDEKYRLGFHCFMNLEDTEKWNKLRDKDYKIYKVRMDDIVATGLQKIGNKLLKCVVAQKIKIIKEMK